MEGKTARRQLNKIALDMRGHAGRLQRLLAKEDGIELAADDDLIGEVSLGGFATATIVRKPATSVYAPTFSVTAWKWADGTRRRICGFHAGRWGLMNLGRALAEAMSRELERSELGDMPTWADGDGDGRREELHDE